MKPLSTIIAELTRSSRRKHLYHVTRIGNLPMLAETNQLSSSLQLAPQLAGIRRSEAVAVRKGDQVVTLNAHLRIPEAMMAEGVTRAEFHAFLDRHVFFWPTWKDAVYMLASYARREPGQRLAVLEMDAASLLLEHAERIKLSRYDSGSAPRYPHRCRYRKSPAMFLPLPLFGEVDRDDQPHRPSHIREVLVADRLEQLSDYLTAVYCEQRDRVPVRWQSLYRPLAALDEDD